MKAIITTLLVLIPAVAFANSTSRHDPALEKAAAQIVAAKMGEIRGGFNHDEEPGIVDNATLRSANQHTGSVTGRGSGSVWHNGLAPARGVPAYRLGKI